MACMSHYLFATLVKYSKRLWLFDENLVIKIGKSFGKNDYFVLYRNGLFMLVMHG